MICLSFVDEIKHLLLFVSNVNCIDITTICVHLQKQISPVVLISTYIAHELSLDGQWFGLVRILELFWFFRTSILWRRKTFEKIFVPRTEIEENWVAQMQMSFFLMRRELKLIAVYLIFLDH